MDKMGIADFCRALHDGRRDFSGVWIDGEAGPLLENIEIADVVFSGGSLDVHTHNVRFVRCTFASFIGRYFGGGRFENCDFSGATIKAELSDVRMIDCAFSSSTVMLDAERCRFEGSTHFRKAEISSSTFDRCVFSADTERPFEDAHFGRDVTMDLETFASLPSGVLSSWQESAIAIADDAVRLRQAFSGLKRSLYLLLLFLFLAPYLLFVARAWVSGLAACGVTPCEPLYRALFAYAMQGGSLTVATYAFVFAYHVVRTVLVAKASTLEVESAARHTRVRFDLDSPVMSWLSRRQSDAAFERYMAELAAAPGSPVPRPSLIERLPVLRWRHLAWFLRHGLLVNLALLLVHAVHFLRTPVP